MIIRTPHTPRISQKSQEITKEYSKIPLEWQYKWENFADGVITPSMWTGDKFLEAGLNPGRLFVIPNGYDEKIYNKTPEESKFFDSKKFTFLFVGNHQRRNWRVSDTGTESNLAQNRNDQNPDQNKPVTGSDYWWTRSICPTSDTTTRRAITKIGADPT